MWSSINIASAGNSILRDVFLVCGLVLFLTKASVAQSEVLQTPATVTAGSDFSIPTLGSGKGTFYLLGPGYASEQQVQLGENIHIKGENVSVAGRYFAIACSETCQSASFWVTPGQPASLSFLVHPSRVPVQADDAISGVAIPFDRFHNQVLTPLTVDFTFSAGGGEVVSRSVATQQGIAWFRTRSGRKAGAGLIVASLGDIHVRRIVQQVASEPCNLRIRAQRGPKGITVQTEPVQDCSGNQVPDGTIITFTKTDANGKSTVDSPLKQGVARAQMTGSLGAVISVASGVTMGNSIRVVP